MANEIQEIKSRLAIEDLVGEYLPLKKAGMNLKACCPFHNEKSPSFVVSPQKQIWHCFGCGAGGDVFTFVERIENVEFAEALRMLAKKTGVVLQRSNPKLRNEQNTLMEISALSQKFFHVQFLKSEHAQKAREYVKNRGITKESIENFGIGYGLDSWDALSNFLYSRKFQYEDMAKIGIVIQKEKGGFYDRFRHRLMFPIRNVQGEVVGFTGRILDEEQKGGKYVNSPQSLIYNKSKVVYGLFEGKQAIKETGGVVVVEGQMDVIANHQAGVKNVVASSGTAFTQDQLKLIKRYTNTLLFSFDADNAGQAALLRGVEIALEEGMKVKVIVIPDGYGKDPDECIQKDPAVWRQAVIDAVDIIQYYISKKLDNFETLDGAGQSVAIDFVLEIIALLPDTIEQTYWLKEISRKVTLDLPLIKERFSKIQSSTGGATSSVSTNTYNNNQENFYNGPRKPVPQVTQKRNPLEVTYKQLLALIFVHPAQFKQVFDTGIIPMIIHDFFSVLYKNILSFYNISNQNLPIDENGQFDYPSLIQWMYEQPHFKDGEFSVFAQKFTPEMLLDSSQRLLLYAQEHYALLQEDQVNYEISIMCQRIRESYSKVRIKEISRLLDQETDPEKIKTLSDEFNSLIINL